MEWTMTPYWSLGVGAKKPSTSISCNFVKKSFATVGAQLAVPQPNVPYKKIEKRVSWWRSEEVDIYVRLTCNITIWWSRDSKNKII